MVTSRLALAEIHLPEFAALSESLNKMNCNPEGVGRDGLPTSVL